VSRTMAHRGVFRESGRSLRLSPLALVILPAAHRGLRLANPGLLPTRPVDVPHLSTPRIAAPRSSRTCSCGSRIGQCRKRSRNWPSAPLLP
jgi:hypothetical protein